MIYNSNGNNTPYQTGGNAKVNKQLKELEEAIESVNDSFNDFLGKIDLYTGEDFIHGYTGANRFTDNTNRVKALEATVNGTQGTKSLDQKILDVDAKVNALGTEVNTGDVNATNGDFHKVVAGKYVFQNGYSITGTNICKINNGSVVYATDGTNSVLVDYTDKDAWVAKAKVEDGEHFSIYSNGVLTFTKSGGWSVYVIGNDFDTDLSVPEETPINIETGVTIGGNLYAALGREYDFDSITSDEASIRIATITGSLSAPSASIDAITSNNIIVQDLVADDANIESLNNSERNFTGYVDVPTHATNINEYIKLNRFTGTYNLKLVKNVNGANETLFTATVIWNGQYPVVDYHENQNLLDRDYLYSFVLTDQGLYFVTQGDGRLYYGWDSFDAVEPESSVSIDDNETVIVDYETVYADRTVFLGNRSAASGMDVLGEVHADYFSQTGDKTGFDFRGNATLATLPSAVSVGVGAVYNITEDGYTDARFVEGAGKPINAGDDVIAVAVEDKLLEIDDTTDTEAYNNIIQLDNLLLIDTLYGYKPPYYGDFEDWTRLSDRVFRTFKTSTGRLLGTIYDDTHIYYSDDNGTTWQMAYGYSDYPRTYEAFTENNGRLFFQYMYSDDNGETWQHVPTFNSYRSSYFLPLHENVILGIGNYYIYKSNDNGDTWTQVSTFSPEAAVRTAFYKDGVILLSKVTDKTYRSTDEGETWELVSNSSANRITEVNNNVFILLSNGVYTTTDMGLTLDPFLDTINANDIYYFNNSYYLTGSNPGIYKYTEKDKVLKWDKFAAGVNYDNFAATNITASTALKSEGTLEVDGTSQFDDDVTVNADLSADKVITPDLEVTGNETVSGNSTLNNVTANTVIIGDLD